MTDKEIIEIDGVDVSGCENYRPKDRFTCHPYICNCHQKPDCYFKQLQRSVVRIKDLEERIMGHSKTVEEYCDRLARKEQEINNVHEYYKELRSNATELANKYTQLRQQLKEKEQELYFTQNEIRSKTEYIQEQRDIIKKLEQKCEELKKNNKILCDLYKNVDSCLQKRTEKFDRYRKALEEIEKFIEEEDWSLLDYVIRDINDIINKAKGEGNENKV